jgi:uncharacterized OsmC-like protein
VVDDRVTQQASTVLQRQRPLRSAYRLHPEQAIIHKRATTISTPDCDALHGVVIPGEGYGVTWRFGVDRAVGGLHDAPNPGEMLCAALAACEDATIRMVADALGVTLERLEVEVNAKVDARGSMAIEASAPVGFGAMQCKVRLGVAAGTHPESVERLLRQAERSCINLATLRQGVAVTILVEANGLERTVAAPEPR